MLRLRRAVRLAAAGGVGGGGGGFAALPGLPAALAGRVEAAGYAAPTAVQREAIPSLLKGWTAPEAAVAPDAAVLRAQTGSGKTLAYVLPLLARLGVGPGEGDAQPERGDGPRALVLVPSPELARQVAAVVRAAASPGLGGDETRALLDGRADAAGGGDAGLVDVRCGGEDEGEGEGADGFAQVLISTPRVAARLLLDPQGRASEALRRVEVVVADEAETVMRPLPRHAPERALRRRARHPKPGPQLLTALWREEPGVPALLVSATGSAPLRNAAHQAMIEAGMRPPPRVRTLAPGGEEGTLAVPSHIAHAAVPLPSKGAALRSAAALFSSRGLRSALVVVDARESAERCAAALRRLGLRAASLRALAELPPAERAAAMAGLGDGSSLEAVVCTEEGARGLHLPGLEAVVLCSPSPSPASYTHMAGRCGRSGVPGTVYALLTADDAERHAQHMSFLGLVPEVLEL